MKISKTKKHFGKIDLFYEHMFSVPAYLDGRYLLDSVLRSGDMCLFQQEAQVPVGETSEQTSTIE